MFDMGTDGNGVRGGELREVNVLYVVWVKE